MSHLGNNNLLNNEQHGFSKKKCCANLIKSMDLITQAMEENLPVDIIFLDMKKAFDSLPHNRLGLKLKSYGFNNKAIRQCKNLTEFNVLSATTKFQIGLQLQVEYRKALYFFVYCLLNNLPNELSTNVKYMLTILN
nr:uncharacterized protein LOC124818287 [Hydra vulgaris]